MIISGAICEDSDCTVIALVVVAIVGALALFAAGFIWGIWYSVYHRRRRAGARRLAAHLTAGLAALLPVTLAVGPGTSFLGEPIFAAAAITAALASMAWGIRTWRANRRDRRVSADRPTVHPPA